MSRVGRIAANAALEDGTNDVDRSFDRYRRALTSSGAGVLSQVVQLSTAVLTVSLTLNYLGNERYGLWMTLSSVALVIVFADLGVGIGLQNELARCFGAGDKVQARAAFSTALAFYLSIFALVILLILPSVARLPLSSWIQVKSAAARSDLVPALRMVVLGLAVGLLAGLAQRLLEAYQRGYEVQLALTVGRLASVAAIWLTIQFNGGMPLLLGSVVILPHLFVIATGIRYLLHNPWLTPSFRMTALSTLTQLLSTGGVGLLAVAAYALLSAGAVLVIASRWGAGQVTAYSVTMRIVTLATGLLYTLISPLWPAYGEAIARGDRQWVRAAFRRSVAFAAPMFCVGFFVLAFSGRPLIRLWTGSDLAVPSQRLLWACVVFGLLSIWNVLASTLLNGMGRFLGQATYGLFLAVSFLCLASQSPMGWGLDGVVWVIDVGYALRCAMMAIEVKAVWTSRLHSTIDVFTAPEEREGS